jgi:lincosamide nucleotidyltransferase A/C/D/E
MRSSDALGVLRGLDAAGAQAWIVGGWGVDALLGQETRPHEDLDVAFDPDRCSESRVVAAVEAAGFVLVDPDAPSGHWSPRRLLFQDGRGVGVDLMPARLHPLSDAADRAPAAQFGPDDLATGNIAGTPVACLSAPAQLRLHEGYDAELRDVDRRDVAALCRCFDLPAPQWAADAGGAARPERSVSQQLVAVRRVLQLDPANRR